MLLNVRKEVVLQVDFVIFENGSLAGECIFWNIIGKMARAAFPTKKLVTSQSENGFFCG